MTNRGPEMNLYPLIADKIEREPTLIRTALETVRRWLSDGQGPETRLRAWERLLIEAEACSEGLARLLSILRDESETARRLKDFGPFPGLLTRDERRGAILSCTYDH